MMQLSFLLIAALFTLNSAFADEVKTKEPSIDKKEQQTSTEVSVKKTYKRIHPTEKNSFFRNRRIQYKDAGSNVPVLISSYRVLKNPAWRHVTPELSMQKSSETAQLIIRVRRSPSNKLLSLRKEIVIDVSTAWIQ